MVALAKLCVPARMLAAVVDMKLETLLRTLAYRIVDIPSQSRPALLRSGHIQAISL